MRTVGYRLAGLVLVISGSTLTVAGQEKPLPPADRAPHLILAHKGAHAPVTALAFAPDARTLYVGGFDKQVRRYVLVDGKYEAAESFRVPIGPGNAGVVNAIAVSPDGKWVAVAGRAPMRGEVWGTADDGIREDPRRLPPLVRRDSGVVYLFDPAKPDGGKVIRGQESEVRALAFANPSPAGGPVLVTAGIEWDENNGKESGVVRVFDAITGQALGFQSGFPRTDIPPGLAAWAAGPGNKGVRAAISWQKAKPNEGGELVVWDVGGKPAVLPDTIYNAPLAVRVEKGGAAEVITGGIELNGAKKYAGRLAVRSTDPVGKPERLWLNGAPGSMLVPLAVAPLAVKDVGNATAVLAQVEPPPVGAGGRPTQLLLIGLRGDTLGKSLSLAGVSDQMLPVLTASPDGRFVAVAGFTDNRVEVYNAASLAAGEPKVEKLEGDKAGFSNVAFLAGGKLWLGGAADTPVKGGGGVVLDLDRAVRTATPAKDLPAPDAPAGGMSEEFSKPDAAGAFFRRVSGVVGAKPIALEAWERATAAAFLPGKPAWDKELGPVVAVAYVEDFTQAVGITLYDATTGKQLYRFVGPTLPVRSLAFSATRALLAGAGGDGTVAVWSMKNVSRPLPAIEGLYVTSRDGVLVSSVQAKSLAEKAGLKVGDVIESVANAEGVQKPVKTPIDFQVAIRGLKIGDNAQVKVKDKVVAIAVGTAAGGRHPLFTLWVDPEAKGGKHDWVGWMSSGPYETNSEAAEGRIGWLTTTGDPARPVTYAGANQYRKLFYKRDMLRRLVETADPTEIGRILPPRPPTLVVSPPAGVPFGDGPLIVREKLDSLSVSLNDPDEVLDRDLDRAELRWQISGPTGASAWTRVPFAAGSTALDLRKHDWKRGEYRVHAKLFKSPADEVPLLERAVVVCFHPRPTLAVKIDGEAVADGAEISTKKDEVEVTATADAKANPEGVAVTLSWTGGKPVELTRNADGTYGPTKVKLQAAGATAIRAVATNRGEGVTADEARAVEARVSNVAMPKIKLLVLTPHDSRTDTNAPYVVSTNKVTLTATVESANPLAAFEWKVGDAGWAPGQLDEKTKSQTRELPLLPAGATLVVQVRATAANKMVAEDTAKIVYEEMPVVSVDPPPAEIAVPELKLAGGLKVLSKRPFKVRVVVTSSRTGRTREFDPTVNAALTQWEAGITLFPGENKLGYVVSYDNDRKELRREGLIDVRYVRPPLVVAGAPLDVGTGTVGDLALAVISAPDAAPSKLTVDGAPVGFSTHAKPLAVFGLKLWVLKARGVAVPDGPVPRKPVTVVVGNAERASQPVLIEVLSRVEVKLPPPEVLLTRNGGLLALDRPPAPVGDGRFPFDLKVTSATRLTRVEVWHGRSADVGMVLLDVVKAADAVEVKAPGGGFQLIAQPVLNLRPGTENYIRVVASSDGRTAKGEFTVTYTPPPVRVVIDSIQEPNGKLIEVASGSAAELRTTGYVIDVKGHVRWDFDDAPVATDRNLEVVFIANGVAHLPKWVELPREGKDGKEKKRHFSGRVYLNATGDPNPKAPGRTHVRVELRPSNRVVPLPQEGPKPAEFVVTSDNPLRKQRLHLLMFGVQVRKVDQKPLIDSVIKGIGGKIPAGNPNFTTGSFEHPRFGFAYLYPPRLDYTKGGDLNALLLAVRDDIKDRVERAGEDWVNDVILVYYEGEDWQDESGRRFLHSAPTLTGAEGKNPAFAIRLDNLPPVAGLPVVLGNVVSDTKEAGRSFVNDLPYLRYAFEDPAETAQLLVHLEEAVKAERQVGRILTALDLLLVKASSKPAIGDVLPERVAERVISDGAKKKP